MPVAPIALEPVDGLFTAGPCAALNACAIVGFAGSAVFDTFLLAMIITP
jgi:hypothetical protein